MKTHPIVTEFYLKEHELNLLITIHCYFCNYLMNQNVIFLYDALVGLNRLNNPRQRLHLTELGRAPSHLCLDQTCRSYLTVTNIRHQTLVTTYLTAN